MQTAYSLAAAVAFLTFVVHTFVGGVYVVRPLLAADDLTRASRWLAYYCWHIATVVILFMTAGFAYAAMWPHEARVLTWFLCALALALSALSATVALKGGIHPLRFPSTSLFAVVGVLAIWGGSTL